MWNMDSPVKGNQSQSSPDVFLTELLSAGRSWETGSKSKSSPPPDDRKSKDPEELCDVEAVRCFPTCGQCATTGSANCASCAGCRGCAASVRSTGWHFPGSLHVFLGSLCVCSEINVIHGLFTASKTPEDVGHLGSFYSCGLPIGESEWGQYSSGESR